MIADSTRPFVDSCWLYKLVNQTAVSTISCVVAPKWTHSPSSPLKSWNVFMVAINKWFILMLQYPHLLLKLVLLQYQSYFYHHHIYDMWTHFFQFSFKQNDSPTFSTLIEKDGTAVIQPSTMSITPRPSSVDHLIRSHHHGLAYQSSSTYSSYHCICTYSLIKNKNNIH